MNLPVQAAPVMRGPDRSQGSPPSAASHGLSQSQLSCDSICALVPAQYKALCAQLCTWLGPVIFH